MLESPKGKRAGTRGLKDETMGTTRRRKTRSSQRAPKGICVSGTSKATPDKECALSKDLVAMYVLDVDISPALPKLLINDGDE